MVFYVKRWRNNAFLVVMIVSCLSLLGCKETPQQVSENTTIASWCCKLQAYIPALKGKRVGLVVNQTSEINGQHLVDLLLDRGVVVRKIFAPEHGFRGDHDAGAHVKSTVDAKTGIDVVSIYGSNKKPNPEVLADLDVIIFDIQDVGVRFYTYISSMHYMMEAAAENGKSFIVLTDQTRILLMLMGLSLTHNFVRLLACMKFLFYMV